MTEPNQWSAESWTPSGLRRRTHPVTPVIGVARAAPLVVVAFVAFEPGVGPELLLIAGGVLLIGLVVGVLAYLSWSRFTFWFDDDGDLRVDQGVLTRTQRRLQVSRLQSVDVVQPLLARLAGLAEVRVEVAGAGESRATISYLTMAEAGRLRAEVLARSAGVHPEAGEAPEDVVRVVPASLLVRSLLVRGTTFFLLMISLLVVAVIVATEGAGGLVLLIFTGGVPLLAVFNEFARYFDFTVARSPDGLRIRSGLLQTRSQTVPPGRVHAIGVEEPLLWRRFGWMRVVVTLAGAPGANGDDGLSTQVLLPVGTQEQARRILMLLVPERDEAATWLPVPARARVRAPFQYKRLAVALSDSAFLTRSGWLTWRSSWVPNARTQSVTVEQGPWQRQLGLATIHVDTVAGPVAVVGLHRDAGEARALCIEQARRARLARTQDRSVRWMRTATGDSVATLAADSASGEPRGDGEAEPGGTGRGTLQEPPID